MIETVCPLASTHALSRSFSTGVAELAIMLWRSPIECPTSCDETKRIKLPISSSLKVMVRARLSTGPHCTIYHFLSKFITL